jgi:uncharacterized protein (DUF1501 family)
VAEDELDDALHRLSRPVARSPLELSRRRFIAALLGSAAGAAVLPSWAAAPAWAADPVADDEGILVVIMMGGGNDGMNTVCPVGDPRYFDLRGPLAVTAANGLDIGDDHVRLHPSLVKLRARYQAGQVAVVQGVGYAGADLSHFTSMATWMAGSGEPGPPTSGWLGRWLDDAPGGPDTLHGVAIGSSVPLHLVGRTTRATGLPEWLDGAFGSDPSDPENGRMYDAVRAMAAAPSGRGPWADALAANGRDTMDLAVTLDPVYDAQLPEGDLSRQLAICARLVNADLGVRVLSTGYGDFDHHANQAWAHADRLAELDRAIDLFYLLLDPAWRNRVTILTFSEFGRRPERNDSGGTDHGTASACFVVGDRVAGGLYGEYPSLDLAFPWDNLESTVDFRSVYASIVGPWLGGDPSAVVGGTFEDLGLFAGPPSP